MCILTHRENATPNITAVNLGSSQVYVIHLCSNASHRPTAFLAAFLSVKVKSTVHSGRHLTHYCHGQDPQL